ncbi:hypothetical protein LTR91_007836 [Friedmanniomyces endolithicus]|uniref:Uncharacterized protein n=1 Tax=Friedmanniomyces endolithicus TaxID=329885 RepID=A0AAN6KQP2_9PEZI|nr:hypothetical protein LTR35_012007 [Friedmanniomyces endolithicus]KAK0279858.1 hypothetical protein LTS00_013237 [Friedmanniomyces endolithicus]KAK0305352.1 hypothetical protein LTR01_006877 [Friedmanniomyces endolithicus]KAK0835633.1 hypothetical protein LTR73_000130 [Friedmanniomyces endolithicus]KAK0977762.1 hypothetical protein LTS01_012964 [Friedmanniomyces endolithicus]
MAEVFFSDWKLWEKLCFALACAIVVTVLLGALKLGYIHWRLRKYTGIAEKEKREQAIQRQMSQRRRHDAVPFGIRALESGIETEGVWVSRPNTPECHSRESSAGSLMLKQYPRSFEDADIEKQIPRIHQKARSRSPAIPGTRLSAHFGRTASEDRVATCRASRNDSPDAAIIQGARSRHPPLSYAKYSNTPYVHRYSSTQTSLESLEAAQHRSMEAIRRASTSIHPDSPSSSEDSSHSGHDLESISASAPLLFTQPIPRPRPRKQSVDFDLMQTHRLSQAAETGQLTPRVRKPGQSRDSSVASVPASQRGDYFGDRHRNSYMPSSEGSLPIHAISTPKIDALPAAIRRSSMPDVTPFVQFCGTAPLSPRLVGQDTTPNTRRQSDATSIYTSAPTSPVTQGKGSSRSPSRAALPVPRSESRSSEPKRTSFEKQPSTVIRGHGTGFEILRPGSLNPALPINEHPMQRQRAAPPISLHNSYRSRSRSSSAGSVAGRRLQKKRRQSFGSTTSSAD